MRSILVRALVVAMALSTLVASPSAAAPKRHEGVERYALRLINCTRTGGWVKVDGSCSKYGSGKFSKYRDPLRFHSGIANEVAFPWARRIARAGYCGHTLAGSDVDRRFRSAGFRNDHIGENVGCSYAWSARKMVLRTHRMMQSERSSGGPHWRQMKDGSFVSVGIGVVTAGGNTRIVVNFYGAKP
jgi:hypothetical protein